MAPDKSSLLDGTHPKAPNVSVLIFLLFALLWLGLGLVALSGAALDPASAGANLVKGFFALLATALLAARVRIAPVCVTILGGLILAAPFFVPAVTTVDSMSEFQRESIDRLAKELAKPPAQREIANASVLAQKGYVEPPEIAKIIADRDARIEAWLRDNAAAVRAMEARISKSTPPKKYASPSEFHADLIGYLRAPKAYGGTNWVWFGLWLTKAREMGFPEHDEVPADQVPGVTEYAGNWLENHPDAVNALAGIMTTGEVDDQSIHVRETSAASSLSISLWIVLFAVGAAWAGRAAFFRPWDAFQFSAWAVDGMRRLIRQDKYAWARILGGLAMMGLLGALIVVLAAAHFNNRPIGKLIVGLMVMSGMIVCSGLSFAENEPSQNPDSLRTSGVNRPPPR